MAVVFAQLVTGGETPRRARRAGADPRRARATPCPGVTIEDCGHKGGLNGVDNGRICVRRGARAAGRPCSTGTADVAADGTYSSPIENPTRRFFTMLGTLVRGRVSVARRARSAAAKSALTIAVRYGERRRQFGAAGGRRRGRCCSTTARTSGGCCRRWPRRTRCTSRRSELVAGPARRADAGGTDDDARASASWRHAPRASRRSPTWHATATIQTLPRGVRRRRLPRGEPAGAAQGRHRRVHDLRGRQHGAAAAGRQEAADRLPRPRSASSTRSAWCASSPTRWSRPSWRRPRRAACSTGSLGCGAAARDDDVDLLDRDWQRRAVRGAREATSLDGARRRLRRAAKGDGADMFEAVQPGAGRTCCAPPRRTCTGWCWRRSSAAIDRCDDDDAKAGCSAACATSTSSPRSSRDRGWFLEHGRLTPALSKAVGRAVDDLRPHARTLVAGLGVPQEWLAAEVAEPSRS